MNRQVIVTSSGERLVVLPEADYDRLVEVAEDAADGQAVEAFRRKLAAGDEDLIPAAFVNRILDGENRIKVWRDFRGLTGKQLAEKAGLAQGYLSQIENGQRDGTLETMRALARALGVSLDELAG